MRIVRKIVWSFIVTIVLVGCGVNRLASSPTKKYSLQEIEKDYDLYQNILESHHPGLYWYTSKDSMDQYFKWGHAHLQDSMTEPEFRKILNYVTAKISCGHTTVRASKQWNHYLDTVKPG